MLYRRRGSKGAFDGDTVVVGGPRVVHGAIRHGTALATPRCCRQGGQSTKAGIAVWFGARVGNYDKLRTRPSYHSHENTSLGF
jgi:hypothetical protein